MAEFQNRESLSFGDSLFLYLEREGMPLHIASVSVFEGNIPLQRFRRFIARRMALVPRYRQRVVIPPLNLGLPSWEYDEDFDLRNHIREMTLKRGSRAEFQAAAAAVLSATMDRQRPLWDFTLVHGLEGGHTGLITRVHHCLADGLAGIGLMSALLGQKPPLVRMTRKTNSAPARHAAPDLLENFVTACFSAVQQVLTAQSELLAIGQRMVAARKHQAREAPDGEAQLGSLFEQWSRYLPELAAPAQRLPFNVVCRGPQRFHWTEIPVADIKAVRQAAGATFNDVALAAIALTVRRYAESHGVGTADRLLRIVVPVSVRDKVDAAELGNRITFLPVNVPLDMENPRDLLAAVGERMSNLKSARLAEFVGFAGTLLGTIPSLVQALLGPLASQLPLSVCNLIFTNVRGPEGPLHLLGHKMLSCYPYVPIGGEMGMNCAVLSYNGTAYFGFTGDAKAVPDLKRFEKLLAASFAELRRAAGSRGPRKKAARPQAKPAVEATAGAPAADVPQEPPALAKAAVA